MAKQAGTCRNLRNSAGAVKQRCGVSIGCPDARCHARNRPCCGECPRGQSLKLGRPPGATGGGLEPPVPMNHRRVTLVRHPQSLFASVLDVILHAFRVLEFAHGICRLLDTNRLKNDHRQLLKMTIGCHQQTAVWQFEHGRPKAAARDTRRILART